MTVDRFSPEYHSKPVQAVIENNSGERSGVVPLQARGASMGALLFGGIWALGNRVWFGALSFLAVISPFIAERYPTINILFSLVGLVTWCYLIAYGRSLAWTHKRWDSYEEFDKVQRTWAKVGQVMLIVGLVLMVVGGVVFIMMLGKGLSRMNG